MHLGDVDPGALPHELRPERFGEAAHCELRTAVGRLERDGPVGDGRPDLHDGAAVTRAHPAQRRHGAVCGAEVGDVGGALQLVGPQVVHRCKHRRHRRVDPDVDRPERCLDALGGGLDPGSVGDVDRDDHRRATCGADLLGGVGERQLVSCEQRHRAPPGGEGVGGRPADAGGATRDDHDLRLRLDRPTSTGEDGAGAHHVSGADRRAGGRSTGRRRPSRSRRATPQPG